ncbi:MAG: hypothetical protein JW953_13325 [Anaerolineae bacterium]|nr:hypothetical protein [Anaerolineae bacterium]
MKRYTLFILFILIALWLTACGGPETPTAQPTCAPTVKQDSVVQEAREGGAVVIVERTNVGNCIKEVWVVYSDGRMVAENGSSTIEDTATPEDVSTLLTEIEELGFFDLDSTKHTACRDCFSYEITVDSGGQSRTVSAVDGGTDVPGAYWKAFARITKLAPKFPNK